jgi:hypothetical protein
MKKLFVSLLTMLLAISFSQAQYKGKYEGWSIGYVFQGSASAPHYKAFTHIVRFGQSASSNGNVNGGGGTSSFVTACHNSGYHNKAIICIGGAGNAGAYAAACANQSTRTTLIHNILNLVRSNGYDGVDLDWEVAEDASFDGNPAKVATYAALHKEMRDSIDKMNPRPIFCSCAATLWYTKSCVAAAPYVDQLNNMSYYNYVKDMNMIFAPMIKAGVPKSRMAVGFGWDVDNEITDPNDILAKCRYAIDSGYGGIMAWDITSAPTYVLDSIARYVTHTPVTFMATPLQMQQENGTVLFVRSTGPGGAHDIYFRVPSSAAGADVDLEMYDVKGALVKTLYHGRNNSGSIGIPSGKSCSGTYVFKLSTNTTTYTTRGFFAK